MLKRIYMKRIIQLVSLSLVLLIGSANAYAEDPIYTSFFSSKAVGGYDPVAYFTESKPVQGKKKYSTEYMGAEWYFSSNENKNLFTANPGKYAPQYGGYCAWAIANNSFAKGDPNQWSIVDDKLYLNYDAKIKSQWSKDSAAFIVKGDTNWPSLIEK